MLLLVAAIVFLLFFLNSNSFAKLLYPVKYQESIVQSSEEYSLNPLFVASIIRVESNFRNDRVSKKGAMGIMQIMPSTAEWIMERKQFDHLSISDLENASSNIQMGAWYIHSLLNQFSGNMAAAAAAYNAGPGNVSKWIASGQWDGTVKDSDQIPFGETRHYVIRVNYYFEKYTKIYRDGL